MKSDSPRIELLEARRFLSAGDVDLSFGANGAATNANFQFHPTFISQSGGKVLVVLETDIERLNANGSLDTTFASAGHLGSGETIVDAKVAPDGKLVVAFGEFGQSLSRYNADGSADTTFGAHGSRGITGVDHIALQSDGKIVVCDEGTLHRINVDGSDDDSFTSFQVTDGYAQPPIDQPLQLAVDANDKILVSATADGSGMGYLSINGKPFTLARFNADGTIDTTFAGNGFYNASTGVNELLPLSDGKLLVTSPLTGGKTGVVRLTGNGQIDTTFATDQSDHVAKLAENAVALAPDGKIVVHGRDEIERLNADGSADSSFGRVITQGYNNRVGFNMRVDGLLPLAGGATLVVAVPDTSAPRLYRLEGDGTPAGPISLNAGTLSITGSSGDDMYDVQTSNADLIVRVSNGFGRIFNDADVSMIDISAGAGNDTVWLRTAHNSSISAGDGNDTIKGGDGADSIDGGEGADLINGGNGNDSLNGDGGKDSVYGSAGNDTILGGASADRLYGGDGDDQIFGQGGNDRICGGGGADMLEGNAGNDTFLAFDGAIDQIHGSRGNDTAVHDASDVLVGIESDLVFA